MTPLSHEEQTWDPGIPPTRKHGGKVLTLPCKETYFKNIQNNFDYEYVTMSLYALYDLHKVKMVLKVPPCH